MGPSDVAGSWSGWDDGGPEWTGDWNAVPLRGSWFTEAFEGPMSNLQRFISGEDTTLLGSVHDAIKTMAVVEACYESSARGGTPIPAAPSPPDK